MKLTRGGSGIRLAKKGPQFRLRPLRDAQNCRVYGNSTTKKKPADKKSKAEEATHGLIE